jgi:membrane-associated phospholipid phosphatase
MPSLHIAFPVVCTLVAIRSLGRRAGWILRAYTLGVVFAVLYLGEHYFVDVLAGAIIGVAVFAFVARTRPMTRDWPVARLVGVSLALTALSVALDVWRMAG